MSSGAEPIRDVRVLTTGEGKVHREHVYGTRRPELVWIFFGRRWVRLPIHVYLIDHVDAVVLFDTGQDRAVVTDGDYWPDPITGFFFRHVFRDIRIGPDDTLPAQLEGAGYAASQVDIAVVSHLHCDHVGGIADIPQAQLYAGAQGFDYLRDGDHPERATVFRDRIELPGARWNMIDFAPTDDAALAPFTEAFDLLSDGTLMVLPTPGHLPGSVSLLVRRDHAPPLLLVGDLCYDEQLLETDQVPAVCHDPQQLLDSHAKVRALKAHTPGLCILTGHDPTPRTSCSLSPRPVHDEPHPCRTRPSPSR
ncbi:MAG: N-acyl homoserine lactonase family protein [Intrasporangiaceae bacterium]|nr:N-acyl homoserine lactonase family protein [Intrasporangiaceae bacterium]